MTDVIRLRHVWQRQLGPFYTTEDIAGILRMDEASVNGLARSRRVLRVYDDSRRPIFPAFAAPTRVPVADFKRVLDALARSCDEPWMWALWLSGLLEQHGGRCAVDDIADGAIESVLNRARNEDWIVLNDRADGRR